MLCLAIIQTKRLKHMPNWKHWVPQTDLTIRCRGNVAGCQVKKTTRARNLIHAGSFSDFFRGVCRKTLRLLAPTFADLVDYTQNSEMLVVVFCAIIPNLTPIFFYSRTGTGILKNIGRNPTSELWSLKARLFEIELTFSANSGE